MKSHKAKLGVLATLALIFLPGLALGAASERAAIVFVADSRGYAGWRAWCINLYNEAPWQLTLLTVLVIPLAGVVLGLLADFFMARSGINLRSRVLAED